MTDTHDPLTCEMCHAEGMAEEIETMRQVMARTAAIIEAQCLDIPRLAKCRREVLERLVANLRTSAMDPDPTRVWAGERWLGHSLKQLRAEVN